MTAEYTEEPRSGYFNCWTGRYPKSAVRTIDLYMVWRDGEVFPPLAEFPNLTGLCVPGDLLNARLVAEVARTNVTALAISMYDGPDPPDAVFELPRLSSLDMSGCGLMELPDRFTALPLLRHLDLANNELDELPPSLLGLPALVDLDLESNDFVVMPRFARGSPLARLELSNNPFTTLDFAGMPRGLHELLVNGSLEQVTGEVAELTQLRVLALGSKLTELPDLRSLPALRSLQLSGQLGEGLFDRLPNTLEELHGRGSHRVGITRIPPAVGRLTQLRVLDLPFEHITELAPELLEVPLAELCLSSTRLADTPTYAHLPATLRRLELANVGMTRCPPRLGELLELRKLVLNANLVEVTDAVRALPHLQELGLSKPR